MKQTNKIDAFTLSEMIVALILTSIVVGLAFSVLTLVQKHMTGIKQNFNKNTAISKLETSLWIDFNKYAKVEFNDYENKLKFSSEIDSTNYTFSKDYIVKDLDTFSIQIENKLLYFNGSLLEEGKIDAIKLETSKTFQNKELFIYKKNDATTFIN